MNVSEINSERVNDYNARVDELMPLMGCYVTAASAVCVIGMAIDAFNGIRYKKLWFPCKYFSFNAASLTLLAIVVKFLVDLNIQPELKGTADQLATLTSAAFIPTAMSHFLPAMGCMSNKAMLSNSIALGLLVISIVVNMWIPFILIDNYVSIYAAYFVWIPTTLMLFSLAAVVSSAIVLPSTKRSLESKYQEMCNVALMEEQEELRNKNEYGDPIECMAGKMKKYLVMSETSNPQFVMARSVIVSTTSSSICVYAIVTFAKLAVELLILGSSLGLLGDTTCAYSETTKWMWVTQFIGITLASIMSMLRWLVSIHFKLPIKLVTFKKVLRIESRWTEDLEYWRDSFTTLKMGYFHKRRKYLHTAKWFALTYCIGVQIFFVAVSKFKILVSILVVNPVYLWFIRQKKLWVTCPLTDDAMKKLGKYVLLLEGEGKLPNWILKSISRRAENLFQTGKNKRPENLENLLKYYKFIDFNVVREFDQSPPPQEPNCWVLPLITFTSIVYALQAIAKQKETELVKKDVNNGVSLVDLVMKGVNEGLSLVKLIDKNLDKNGKASDVRKHADVTWVGVAVYGKWQDTNLEREFTECKSAKAVLQKLHDSAKRTISNFIPGEEYQTQYNPNWPAKVIFAISMYRITKILTSGKDEKMQTDGELFDQLFVMIAGILAACLTNLPSLIIRMCRLEAMEKREESICEAFLLLGRTGNIIKFLLEHEWPCDPDKEATSIRDWRAAVDV